jgi:hypothetical protein
MIFTVMCIIAMGVCAIVDIAINRTVTWTYIPVLSIAFGYAIIMPMFAKTHKIELTLCALTITILPFLYFMEKIVWAKDWFHEIALPISVVSVSGMWISYLICRFFKTSQTYFRVLL